MGIQHLEERLEPIGGEIQPPNITIETTLITSLIEDADDISQGGGLIIYQLGELDGADFYHICPAALLTGVPADGHLVVTTIKSKTDNECLKVGGTIDVLEGTL